MSFKLRSLTDYLIELDFAPRENIESWVDMCTLIPTSMSMGNYVQLCSLHHRCTVKIERYTGDSRLITAWIATWIHSFDSDRDHDQLPDPDIDIEALDASGTQWDVDLSIEFMEPVLIAADPENGNITWNEQKYALIKKPIIDTAKEITQTNFSDSSAASQCANIQHKTVGVLA